MSGQTRYVHLLGVLMPGSNLAERLYDSPLSLDTTTGSDASPIHTTKSTWLGHHYVLFF